MDLLRDVEELVLALDDAPVRLEPRALHQGDQRVVDLCDAAAEGRRREMADPLALERPGEPLDLRHQTAAADGRVVGEQFRVRR